MSLPLSLLKCLNKEGLICILERNNEWKKIHFCKFVVQIHLKKCQSSTTFVSTQTENFQKPEE